VLFSSNTRLCMRVPCSQTERSKRGKRERERTSERKREERALEERKRINNENENSALFRFFSLLFSAPLGFCVSLYSKKLFSRYILRTELIFRRSNSVLEQDALEKLGILSLSLSLSPYLLGLF
jgi:hypothetical protein